MFNIGYFMESLPIMGMGMLGTFIVMAIIIAVVAILNKVTAPKD